MSEEQILMLSCYAQEKSFLLQNNLPQKVKPYLTDLFNLDVTSGIVAALRAVTEAVPTEPIDSVMIGTTHVSSMLIKY